MKTFENIVILTGAGISAESGINTFRDQNGLWENHRLEDVATPEAFQRNPALVYEFYNQRRAQLLEPQIQPNAAHLAISKLQQQHTGRVTLVTQNVDDLHERGGSESVLHMHGELLSARCTGSEQRTTWTKAFDGHNRCWCCNPERTIRPDIVWFGEMPFHMEQIEQALYSADLFISIGTSGNVYPAAGFVAMASQYGAYCVELNLEPSSGSHNFDDAHYRKASDVVPQFIDKLLKIR